MTFINHENKEKIVHFIKEHKYIEILKILDFSPTFNNKNDLLEFNFTKALCYKGLGRFRRAIYVLLNGIEYDPETNPIKFDFGIDIDKKFKIKYLYFISQLYLMTDQREISKKLYNLIFSYFDEYEQIPAFLNEMHRMLSFDKGLLFLRMGEIDRVLSFWEQCIAKQGTNEDIKILFLLGFLCLYKRNADKALHYFTRLKEKVPQHSLYYKSANMLCKNIEKAMLDASDPSDIIMLYQLHLLKNKGWEEDEIVFPDGFENMIYLKLRDRVNRFEKI